MNVTTEPTINQDVTTIPRRSSTTIDEQNIHMFKNVLLPKISKIMKDMDDGKGPKYRLVVQTQYCTQLYQTIYELFVIYTQNSVLFNNHAHIGNVAKFFSISNYRIDTLTQQAIISSYGLFKSSIDLMVKAMQKFKTALLQYRYECVHKLVLLTCIKQLPLEVVRMIATY